MCLSATATLSSLLATLLTIDSASMFVTPAGPSAVGLGGQPTNVSIPTQQDLTHPQFLALKFEPPVWHDASKIVTI